MPETKRLIYCTYCNSMADTRSKVHICSRYREGVLVNRVKRRWKHDIGAWVLADEDDLYTKVKMEQLRDQAENGAEVEKAKTSTGYETCELPKKEEETPEVHDPKCTKDCCRPASVRWHKDTCPCKECVAFKEGKGIKTYTYSYAWVDVRPWDGIERTRWPNTFDFLLGEYYCGEWEKGKRVASQDYQNRVLHGNYVPEPKTKGKFGDREGYFYDHEYWDRWHNQRHDPMKPGNYYGPYGSEDYGDA